MREDFDVLEQQAKATLPDVNYRTVTGRQGGDSGRSVGPHGAAASQRALPGGGGRRSGATLGAAAPVAAPMLVWPLLLTSLLLGTVSTPRSASAQARHGTAPAQLARTSPMYHVEAKPIVLIENYTLSPDIDEENNLGTANKNNSKKELQDIINNLNEKCKINLSGTFDSIGKLIKALKKLEAEELAACNISKEAANFGGNYFLISEEAIEGPPGEAIHTEFPFFEEFAPPESELIEEKTTEEEPEIAPLEVEVIEEETTENETEIVIPEIEIIEETADDVSGPKFEINEEDSTQLVPDTTSPELESPEVTSNDSEIALVSAIGYVSPEMELAEFNAATSTIAPIPGLGFVSLEMAEHEIEYHPEKITTTESDSDIETTEMSEYEINYRETTTVSIPVLYVAMPEEAVIQNPTKESTQEILVLKPADEIPKTVSELPTLPVVPVLEYEEVLYPDPDEKRIQKVLQNFQRKTQEDQLTHETKKKRKKMSKRNEPSEDLQEENWSPMEKDQKATNVGSGRSLPAFDGDADSDDEDPPEESLPDNDSDIVEKKLDELEANIMSDSDDDTELQPVANEMKDSDTKDEAFDELMAELDSSDDEVKNERSKLMNGNLQRKFTDDEMVQNSVNRLRSDQPQVPAKPIDIELINVNESTGEITKEELVDADLIKPKHVVGKQSMRDMVEDLIAASLIAVFVILALIAMFYTVSFVRSKEKEKCPTITIIESGSPEGTRKYTVGASRKHGTPVCYGKIVKTPRHRQGRHKRERIPIHKTVSSNISTETSQRTTETVALPPPQIRDICPRPLRSRVSRAYSPRPLSPQSVCPCVRSTQLQPTCQTLIPWSQQQYQPREPKRSLIRDSLQQDYQATPFTTPRKLSLQEVELPISPREIPSPDYQPSRQTTPRRLSLRDSTLTQEMIPIDYQASQYTTPRKMSLQNVELPISDMITTQPQSQASQPPSPRRMSLQDVGMPISRVDTTVSEQQILPPLCPRKVSLQDTGLPDTTLPDSPIVTPRKLSLQKTISPPSSPPASSPRRTSDAGLPVPHEDMPMPEYPESYHSKRILFNEAAPVSDNGELVTSDMEATQPDYRCQIPSPPRQSSFPAIAPYFQTREGPMHSVPDKVLRSISRDSHKPLSLSSPRLTTIRSAVRSQAGMQYPYRPDPNSDTTNPFATRRSSRKPIASMHAPDPISEAYDTLDSDSPEIYNRTPYMSDDGGDLSVESYADPVIPSQYSLSQAPISPFLPQPRQVAHSRSQPASYASLPHTYSHPTLQTLRTQSFSGPSATPFQPNQFAYQGGVSAGDFSPRLQYIPKESAVRMQQPVSAHSSVYPVSPLPLGFNQQPITQSQIMYRTPSLPPSQPLSIVSLPYLPEESHTAHMRLMQHIPQEEYPPPAYLPDERAYASHSYIEQQTPFTNNGRQSYAFQNQPSMDGSYVSMPYSGTRIATSPSIQGWIATGAPTPGEVSISNIPTQRSFANIPSENQSWHESFYQPVASSPPYAVSQQQSRFPSYQQLSSRSRQGPDSNAYSRSQGTLQSPLPNVPPPPSPSARSQSQIPPTSFPYPSFQPLSPLSLTLLRDHASDRSQGVPSRSQGSNLYDSFRTSRFEDSGFLKGSPISQSFIHKDYSSPPRSTIPSVSQSFNLSPQRFSSGNNDVFTYADGPKNMVSTPITSRVLSVGIDPEAFHTSLHSTSSISSESSEEGPYRQPSPLRNVADIFPTSSDSVHNSPSFRDKQAGLSSDYSINEISSDPNISNARYYTARSFFNDSSDYLTSE
ncbi:uncharacterized protein LOC116979420 [Amblyraja radiata]|uniref:uncharacterized protein LOC116979420 n=1 Tax=Amblyraja radiata TaxID=386614 RepID=UPI001402E4B0|nr:uncharacterized protein LOC116979420 [Amblyraja radiata]